MPIPRPPSVCVGQLTPLSDASPFGTWSSSDPTIGTVNTIGVVSGVSAGSVTISYTFATGCPATRVVTVNPLPLNIIGRRSLYRVYIGQQVREISVKGRNLSEASRAASPSIRTRSSKPCKSPCRHPSARIKQALEQTPPELGADVAERRIVSAGRRICSRDVDIILLLIIL